MLKTKGFTLIEFILVFTLIGIISAVTFSTFGNARLNSRDSKRKTDVETIRGALERYRYDNGAYITGTVISALVPNYISSLPTDPDTARSYAYTSAAGKTYLICASMESASNQTGGAGCPASCGTTCNYSLGNP
jgi:general secretion pathway protein G